MTKRTDPEFYAQARLQALKLMEEGLGCREVATRVGVGRTTVSKWAKAVGHEWGRKQTEAAAKANAKYGAERRARQILVLADRIDNVSQRMREQCIVFSFGGRDNVYSEHLLERPDSRTLRELSSTIVNLVGAMKSLHAFDASESEDLSDVQRYLALQKGEKP